MAVIDSGVNASLPDLRGAVISGADMNAGKGDGRTDFDTQENGHGTAMAALIAGQGNGVEMVGVAPGAKILPIRAQSGEQELSSGIKYAVDNGAKVINISQGLPDLLGCDDSTKAAITYAIKHDVVIVASAGNDGDGRNQPEWPGECPGILAVGAVDYMFSPWAKTQRQPYVSVAAPGVRTGSINKRGEFIPAWNGTSQASALTAGVVALVRSKFPKMPARDVVQRVIATARDVGSPGRDDVTGYGLVRPYRALVDHVLSSAPNPVYSAWEKNQAASRSSTTPTVSPPTPRSGSREKDQPSNAGRYIVLASSVAAFGGGTMGFAVWALRKRRRIISGTTQNKA